MGGGADVPPADIRLRRGPLCRLASSTTQAVLSLVCLGVPVALIWGATQGRPLFGGPLLGWVWIVVLYVPWLAGVTAWARADADGIRWRYWQKYEFRWEQVRRVELTKRIVGATSTVDTVRTIVVFGKPQPGRPVQTADDQNVRPGEAGGRNLRRFGTDLSALAKRHGVSVAVTSGGWDEPVCVPNGEHPWS